MVKMTKQRKHTKKSTMRKKKRRMAQHEAEHSKAAHERSYMEHEYGPYVVGTDKGGSWNMLSES